MAHAHYPRAWPRAGAPFEATFQPALVYSHIPKSAGTSVAHILVKLMAQRKSQVCTTVDFIDAIWAGERRLTGELTIRREAVQKLTATHYPARDDELLIRYKGPGEPEPPTAGIYVYGGKIDNIVVHNTVFTQVRVTPPLTYRIEIKSEIYFTVAVQEILCDANGE